MICKNKKHLKQKERKKFNMINIFQILDSENQQLMTSIYRIFECYMFPSFNTLFFLINVTAAIKLIKINKKNRFYTILTIKVILEATLALISVGNLGSCCIKCPDFYYNRYYFHFYDIYVKYGLSFVILMILRLLGKFKVTFLMNFLRWD